MYITEKLNAGISMSIISTFRTWLINFHEDESLKKQIILKFLAVGFVPLIVISIVALWLLSNMASNLVTSNLNVLKSSKVTAIEEYAGTIINQVVTASGDPNTADNLIVISRAFNSVFDEAFEQNDTEEYDYDEDIYLNAMRQELIQFYSNDFLPKYQSLNDNQTKSVESLIQDLSPSGVILQHQFLYANPTPLGDKHQLFKSTLDSNYDLNHQRLHGTFKPFLESFGYYDIFLVDNRGNIVYSVYKKIDFGTNLKTGAFKDSGLGEAFKAADQTLGENEFAIIDYAQYMPSYEAPASFISSPVYKYGTQVGVLIFQMPLEAISSVMSDRKGLGKTAEVYLVGQDNLMRSDSYKSRDLYSVDSVFRTNTVAESEPITRGLSGETGMVEAQNYLGHDVLSGYTPVKFGNLTWAMLAEIETSEAFAPVTRLVLVILLVCAIAIAGIVYFALYVANKIISPIKGMQSAMASIAENTDFTARVPVDRNDEIGATVESLNQLLEGLETSIKETNAVVEAMSEGNFKAKVTSDFKGDLLTLKQGVNDSAKAMGQSIFAVNHVVDALSKGDFDQKIDIPLKGELNTLKTSINTSIARTHAAMDEINRLVKEMSLGNFKYVVDAKLEGEFATVVTQANTAMTAVNDAVNNIDIAMSSVANGDLNARIDAELPGQLEQIKENINVTIAAVADVFNNTTDSLGAVAEGKLHAKIRKEFPGQFGTLKASTNETLERLTQVVEQIKEAAVSVNSNSEEILNGNNQLSSRTLQQSADLDSTAASMDEITATVRHTAENAAHANELANSAKESAINGGEVVRQAVAAMGEVNEASSKIADIIGVIDSIAFQTNLLALNAAVEAARAGEQGRGFAVVAGEVRNLAGRSANAAQEIKVLINNTVSKVNAGSELVVQSGETLNEIIQQVENVNNLVAEISNAAAEQSDGIQSVHTAVESIKDVTQQNTAMVEEGTAASENLKNKAGDMRNLMEFFET
ncbi:MAG: methyl-accepting chemotaxis protein [Pseudomonadota bacterium]